MLVPIQGQLMGQSLAEWLSGQDADRMMRYREMLDFYQGHQWQRRPRSGETQLTVNYARVLVRKVASYVFRERPGVQVIADEPGSPDHHRRVEARLNEYSAEYDLFSLDYQTLLDAAVLGDGCFKVVWSERVGAPVISSVDPSGLWAWSHPDNLRDIRRLVQRYYLEAHEIESVYGVAMHYHGKAPIVEDSANDRVLIEINGTVVRDEANPYGYIPYVLFANDGVPHQLWGQSDLVDLFDVCREINRRMTVVSRILQVSGNPIVVLENVTGADGIRADEGAIWEMPEGSRAYLLDMLEHGGVGLHLEFVQLLFRSLFDISETPRTAFGDSGRALSGAALEVEVQPLVQKVQRKQRVWDSVFRRRNALVLDQLERFGGEDIRGVRRTRPLWGSILPRDREALVRSEAMLVERGIHSRRGASAELGDEDPDGEFLKVLDEMRQMEQGDERPDQSSDSSGAE